MTTSTIRHPQYDQYLYDFRKLRTSLDDRPEWFQMLCYDAWGEFSDLGFPTARRGNERWKYTNVTPIARAAVAYPFTDAQPGDYRYTDLQGSEVVFPSAHLPRSWARLEFQDGRPLGAAATNKGRPRSGGYVACSLSAALRSEPEIVRRHLGSLAPIQGDPFVALNSAFLDQGAYVRLPDDCEKNVVLNIAYLSMGYYQEFPGSPRVYGVTPLVTHPRTLIIAGRNTNLTVVESYVGPSLLGRRYRHEVQRFFTNAVTEIVVGEGATVHHYRILDESSTLNHYNYMDRMEGRTDLHMINLIQENARPFHVGTTRVHQSRDSSYNSGSFASGSALARHDMAVTLDAPGAYCSLNGLYYTGDRQHMDNLISIDHASPHTTSRLNYKGILDGKSKAVFGGEVLVRKDAQKADARQTDKNLLLSREAEVDSKPSLLIYADDVQCTHGATAGHIDEDTLFYMQSRGLDKETAGQILIHAFANEIIETVQVEPLRNYLDQLFLDAIPTKGLQLGSAA